MIKRTLLITLCAALCGPAIAHATDDFNEDCPVGLVSGKTLDEEFGPGTSAITRCLEKRSRVKVVFNINQFCTNNCTQPYALGNVVNAINDYEITHGMKRGRDYEIVAVLYSAGADFAVTGNAFQTQVEGLLNKGVKFYLCQNTARRKGIKTDQLIQTTDVNGITRGIEYITSGVTALADFQSLGYAEVHP